MPPKPLESKATNIDDSIKLRHVSKKKILLFLLGTYLFIILLCIVVFFLQNDNYRIFFSFVSYEALFGYTPTLILLSLPLSLISGITCLALCAWNLWHKDSKWLLIIALLAILGVTASFLSTVMMGMGGPAYRETKLEDCPYHNTTTTRDSCYSLAANSVKTCKKITDINLQDKCIVKGLSNTNSKNGKEYIFERFDNCNELATPLERDTCREYSLARNNPLTCLELEDTFRINRCLSNYAKTVSQCDLIKSEYYQSLCYGNLVQTNVEGASCTHFSEERSLAFCYQQSIPYNRGWVCDKNKTLQGMVCEMKDVSWNANTVTTSTLCNIAPTSHLKEWCQAQLAKPNGVINKEEDTQCENIALPDDKFFCYRKIHRIPSTDLCLSIEDEGVKTLCSNAISGIDEK